MARRADRALRDITISIGRGGGDVLVALGVATVRRANRAAARHHHFTAWPVTVLEPKGTSYPSRVDHSRCCSREIPELGRFAECSTHAAAASIVPCPIDVARSFLVDHAAEILGLSRRTVYYRIREGRLRTIRTIGGSQRVLLESIELFLRERAETKARAKAKNA